MQLKPQHLQKYYAMKLAGVRQDRKDALTQTTVSHHHTCLHRALKMAVRWGLLVSNPADAVTPPRPQHTEMQTMNEDDLQVFLATAKPTPYYTMFYTALFTGMRRSELLALRWSDVDLLMCQISLLPVKLKSFCRLSVVNTKSSLVRCQRMPCYTQFCRLS